MLFDLILVAAALAPLLAINRRQVAARYGAMRWIAGRRATQPAATPQLKKMLNPHGPPAI